MARLFPFGLFGEPRPVVAVLKLGGVIGRLGPIRRGMTLTGLADSIERAFKLRRVGAVALVVNSPGGSPVQSALIAKRIRALADENDVRVYAFAEDIAASGGYWLALAADEIYAEPNSIIGSIGVVSGSFGFTGLIERIGVERRLHTAGEKKAMLDPFLPEKAADVKHLKSLQKDIHESFAGWVRERRGKHLKEKEATLFSGAFWTGQRALEMGLVDGLGDIRQVMREKLGEKVKFKTMTPRRSFWRRRLDVGLPGRGRDTGPADWAAAAIAAVEERLIWSRFGL